ncbi:BatD family protein [Agarivorans sp.]|uniref:BatD family protein n=1 Tax=Agarivorans sp. TaxID=1872412 RepID=UPI003D069F98
MKVLSLCFMLLLSFSSYATTEVTATVSQNPVAVGQAFTLEIVANDTLSSNEFDPSVLLRQKFVVGSTSTARQHTSINGQSSTQTRWTTTLLVREEGNYLIPSFNIGGENTQPIHLKAKKIEAIEPSKDQVRMEVSLDSAEVYLGQPVTFTAKIWVANSLDQANIFAPNMLDAKVEKLGDDKQDLEIVDGKRYRTLTRQWLITPEKAGEYEVRGPRLSGLANDINHRARPIDIAAQTLALTVKAPPANFPGQWLPSHDLLLNEEIQPLQSDYQQGQAFTRIINLTIAGITEQQLPEIDIDYGPNFRVYPEPYQDRTIVKDGIVFAQRSLNVALIPVTTGELSLPGWSLPWWDLTSDKLAKAEIKARQIKVVPAPENQALSLNNPTPPTNATVASSDTGSSWLTWLFGFAWLITLAALIWFIRQSKLRPQAPNLAPQQEKQQNSDYWQQFAAACKQGASHQAEQALTNWVNQQQATGQWRSLLKKITAANWANAPQQLDLNEFYQACLAYKRETEQTTQREQLSLSSLNP